MRHHRIRSAASRALRRLQRLAPKYGAQAVLLAMRRHPVKNSDA
jgi:hypothetical protein